MIIYVAIHSQIDVLTFFPKRREEVAKVKGVRLLQGVLMPQAFKVPMRLIQKTWTLLNCGHLVFGLLGYRKKSACIFSFHVTKAL